VTLRRDLRNVRDLFSVAKLCRRLGLKPGRRYARTVQRGARLCRERRFKPTEAFRLGLLAPEVQAGWPERCVSRKELTKVQRVLNPEKCNMLVQDKALFYQICVSLSIPVPEVYAVWRGSAGGRRADFAPLSTPEEWQEFLAEQVPDEFVVKRIRGAYGQGFNVFRRSGDGFDDAAGTHYRPAEFYHRFCAPSMDGGVLLQERLKNHPELVRLSRTEFLQTVRVVTLLDSRGEGRLLHAHFKPIVGPHIVDTFLDGLLGNVEAPLELATGILRPANQIQADGTGVRTIPTHPETGVRFEGFGLPFWEEACALAIRAAEAFWPLRTIGWDVALTPDGPRLVEGNAWWDPPNQHGRMGELFAILKAEISKLQARPANVG